MVPGEVWIEAGEWDTIPRYNGESIWDAESGGVSKAVHRMGAKSRGKQAREVISVDGKTMRGSGGKEQKPIHMVSAWASKARAVFGQMSVEEKTNEITAVPELLELLDIENTIITADAMSCQKDIVKKNQRKRRGLCNRAKRQSAYAVQGNKRVLHQRIGNASVLSACQPDKNSGERSWQDRNKKILSLH